MPNYDFECPSCHAKKEFIVPSYARQNGEYEGWPRCVLCNREMVKQQAAPPFTVQGGTPKFHK